MGAVKNYLKTVLLGVAFIVLQAPGALAESEWNKSYDKEGIQVFTRSVDGSGIDEFRAVTLVSASVDSLLAVLADPEACSKWIHNCSHAEIIDSAGFSQRNTYQVNDMPWPVKDRDLVMEILIEENEITGQVTVNMVNRPTYKRETDLVRIPEASGKYVFTPSPDGTVIEWQQHTDPGGSLPAWLINALIIDVPVNTLANLGKLAEREPYTSARLSRDGSGLIVGWAQR